MKTKEIKAELERRGINYNDDRAYNHPWTQERIPARIDLYSPDGKHFKELGVHSDCGHQGANLAECWKSIAKALKAGYLDTQECTGETPCDDWRDDSCPMAD